MSHFSHFSLLQVAIRAGRYEQVRRLLELGADVNAFDDGQMPLHVATYPEGEAIARLLIAAGAKLDARDMYEGTPLHRAAQYWATRTPDAAETVARLLIESGADVTAIDHAMRTPLHWAAYKGHPKLAC
jgi:ankyrin repeat protein